MDVSGVAVQEMPEGWTVLEVVAVVKALDQDGDVGYVVRASESLGSVEASGMLRAAMRQQDQCVDQAWRDED